MTTNKAPDGLAAGGQRLWRSVADGYELEQYELLLLEQACRTADMITALTAAVGAELVDSNGRVRAEIVECRAQRIMLARLLAALRVPLADEGTVTGRPQRRAGVRGVYGPRAVS